MPLIRPKTDDELCPQARPMIESYAAQTGLRPNVLRTVAWSPTALKSVFGLLDGLDASGLDPCLRERVALAVAQANGCTYCLSAHSVLGKSSGLDEDAIEDSRWAECDDPRNKAVLGFVRSLVIRRGAVCPTEVERLRGVGFDERQIVELVAFVSVHVFLNYLTEAARTPIDFPMVRPDDCPG